MEFFVEAMGIRQAQTRFNRMGAAALDAAPAFVSIADMIFKIEEATFNGGGRRGGGSWKKLTDEWLTRKVRTGLDPRINHATLALRKSMTVLGAEHQNLEIGPQSLRISSDLPYAATAQRHRPFVKFTLTDKQRIRAEMRRHLVNAFRRKVS